MKNRLHRIWMDHRVFLVFMALYLGLGMLWVWDYGITWDERYQRDYGQYVHHYVHYNDTFLHEYKSRYHGPAFQYVLYQAQHWLKPSDPGDVYRLRHVMTFLFSFTGAGFFYLLLLRLFRSREWAMLGVLLLVLHPRIFAHGFYNSKDAAFMYMFIIAMWTMMRMLERPGWLNTTLHALACAWLIDMRILGAYVPIFTGMLILPQLLVSVRQSIALAPRLLWYATLTFTGIIAFWPTLWHAPIEELFNALETMSAYPWDDQVLFRGDFLTPDQLPWYYLPWWMAISTPLPHLALIASGVVTWFFTQKRLHWPQWTAVTLWVTVPVASVIWKGAVVYDGWRHLYFVWPGLVIVGLAGTWGLFNKTGTIIPRAALWVTLTAALIPTATWICMNHPHQAVYFNSLVRKDAYLSYEMDYWGGSYLQALKWLTAKFPEGELKVIHAHTPGYLNQDMLPMHERDRIVNVSHEEADFLLSIHRYPREFEPFVRGEGMYARPLHVIRVDGNPIVGVYDLRH
jgi:hypothetical protein